MSVPKIRLDQAKVSKCKNITSLKENKPSNKRDKKR